MLEEDQEAPKALLQAGGVSEALVPEGMGRGLARTPLEPSRVPWTAGGEKPQSSNFPGAFNGFFYFYNCLFS